MGRLRLLSRPAAEPARSEQSAPAPPAPGQSQGSAVVSPVQGAEAPRADQLPAACFMADGAGGLRWASRDLLELSGRAPEEALPAPPDLLRERDWLRLAGELARSGRVRAFETALRRRDGAEVHVELEVRVATQGAGGPRWIGCARDVSSYRAREADLFHRSSHDPLTDLPNRTLFADRLEGALLRLRRQPKRSAALLYLDLDGFKPVNDQLGHAAGDALLRCAAQRLRGSLRPADTVARLGGDEFAVIVEDVSGPADYQRVARRILADFAPPFWLEGRWIPVGISLGIAPFRASACPREALERADRAMYTAKRLGGRRFVVPEEAA